MSLELGAVDEFRFIQKGLEPVVYRRSLTDTPTQGREASTLTELRQAPSSAVYTCGQHPHEARVVLVGDGSPNQINGQTQRASKDVTYPFAYLL